MKVIQDTEVQIMIFDGLSLGFLMLNEDLVVENWNHWLEHATGISKEKAIGQLLTDIFPSLIEDNKIIFFHKCISSQKPVFLSPLFHNYLFPLEIVMGNEVVRMKQNCKLFPIKDANENDFIYVIIEDQTDHFFHEFEINRLTTILKSIRNIDKITGLANSIDDLASQSLDVLMNEIGYSFGFLEMFNSDIELIFDFSNTELTSEQIELTQQNWKKSELNSYLKENVVSKKHTIVIEDLKGIAGFKQSDLFLEFIINIKVCSLPLVINETVVGVLTLFSKELNVFKGEELQLLIEIAQNISKAIDGIETTNKRKEIESKLVSTEKSYQAVFENTGTATVIVNSHGIIEQLNRKFEEFSEYSVLETENILEWNSFFETNRREELDKLLESDTKDSNGVEFVFITKGEKRKDILLVIERIADRDKWVVSMIDISETKMILKELEIKNKQLEIATEKAQGSDRHKSAFLANMSHEIRTPMNGIVGMIDLLSRESNLTKDQRESIDVILQASDDMLYIVNSILDSSKLELMKMEIIKDQINLHAVLNKTVTLYTQKAISLGVNLECNIAKDVPLYINTDGNRLTQILSNLITNAVKFSNKGKVIVNVTNLKQRKSSADLKFEVIDFGIGISKEDQAKVFDKFTQLDEGYTKSTKGTGLGLSICKELIELLGGEIGVISEKEKGSTFWFTIKADLLSEKASPEVTILDVIEPLNLRVLIAEDNEINIILIKKMMQKMGCEFEIAKNGLEAIEKFEEDKFDLILMDIQMPLLDGLEATKTIQKRYVNVPPIIGLSANAMDGAAEKYILEGMSDYLTKPYTLESLFHKICSNAVVKDNSTV